MNWQDHLLTTPAQIADLLARLRRVAVLGMRSERHADRPAHYVGASLKDMGLQIVPVDLHEPELQSILGEPVYRRLADIPGDIDLVDVFRRPVDIPGHLDDILAKRPAAVWLQTGIRHDAIAERLAREGIDVVQDHCLMVEYRRWRART
jgi:predicted CoA-binding protein